MAAPTTKSGTSMFLVLSAMQKHVRRGREREALECAIDLALTSGQYFKMMVNRLRVILYEDVGIANPAALAAVPPALALCEEMFARDKSWRQPLATSILLMCRGPKSRIGDELQCVVLQQFSQHGKKPTIPDEAYDKHTHEGRRKGRSFKHFFEEASRLSQGGETELDLYRAEAEALWPTAVYPKAPRLSADVADEPGGDATLFPAD